MPLAQARQVGTEQSVLGYMTNPGQWAGGFAAWDEFGVYFATGRAESPGRVLRLPSPQLRRLSEQWFPFGLHFIEGLVNTVRRIESTARQREALVALGTLPAGLAHELNNQLSPIRGYSEVLTEMLEGEPAMLAERILRGAEASAATVARLQRIIRFEEAETAGLGMLNLEAATTPDG